MGNSEKSSWFVKKDENMKYKLEKYPLRRTMLELGHLIEYQDKYQDYEVVGISVEGIFDKNLWVLYKKKSELS